MATQEEIDAIKAQALSDMGSGIESFEGDGQRVVMRDPLKTIEGIQALNALDVSGSAVSQPHRGIRFTQLLPPGGGG